jgi:hypothetical protein
MSRIDFLVANCIRNVFSKFYQLMETTISFFRIIRLNWIGHVNRMDSDREVRQVSKFHPNRPRGSEGSTGIALLFF